MYLIPLYWNFNEHVKGMKDARYFFTLARSVKNMKETHNIAKMRHKCDLEYSKTKLEPIHYENYRKCMEKTVKI